MKPNSFLFALLFMGTLFTSCKKSNIIREGDFESSYKEWLSFKETVGNSYRYIVSGGSWVGMGWQTDITVSKGKVAQRHFKLSFPAGWTGSIPEDYKMEWTENENEINSHKNTAAAEAVTLDEVYEKARNNWLKKRDHAKIYFEAKNNGLISSCGYIEDGCQDDCFNGITITSIEAASDFQENIKIRMSENIDSVPRQLNLDCFTEKIFPCSNYFLQSSFSITNDKITIHFIKVNEPGICLTSTGPASAIINLGNLQNKKYELEINVGNRKVSGELGVSSGDFKVALPTQARVEFVNPEMNRIPDNAIYGTVQYHSDTAALVVQKFLDSLQFFGAVKAIYTPGDYENFQIGPDGQIVQTQDPGYYFTRYFIYNYTKDPGQLRDLVKRFGTAYPDLLLIALNTSKGEIFYSWTK